MYDTLKCILGKKTFGTSDRDCTERVVERPTRRGTCFLQTIPQTAKDGNTCKSAVFFFKIQHQKKNSNIQQKLFL